MVLLLIMTKIINGLAPNNDKIINGLSPNNDKIINGLVPNNDKNNKWSCS